MNRTVVKQDLRRIAEVGIVGVLGRVPRRNRREAGRILANEGYRKLNNLPRLNHRASKPLVDWIAKSYGEYQDQLSKPSNSDSGGDSNPNGADTKTLAD